MNRSIPVPGTPRCFLRRGTVDASSPCAVWNSGETAQMARRWSHFSLFQFEIKQESGSLRFTAAREDAPGLVET
jgi:hypothetical protein